MFYILSIYYVLTIKTFSFFLFHIPNSLKYLVVYDIAIMKSNLVKVFKNFRWNKIKLLLVFEILKLKNMLLFIN